MKRPHLLRVDDGPGSFAALFRAAAEAGVKVGWLELDGQQGDPAAPPVPPSLAEAAGHGALRAVAVAAGGSVAVKPRSGPPVLDDLLREHFLGCRLVLVRGLPEPARLVPTSGGFRVEPSDGPPLELAAPALVARLARPRPWSAAETG